MNRDALAARLRNSAGSRLRSLSTGFSNLYPPREPCIHAGARQSRASRPAGKVVHHPEERSQ